MEPDAYHIHWRNYFSKSLADFGFFGAMLIVRDCSSNQGQAISGSGSLGCIQFYHSNIWNCDPHVTAKLDLTVSIS